MTETFKQILERANPTKPVFVTGTVAAVDESTYAVDVAPDDGGELIRNVPIRVMRHANKNGVIVVPKPGTEVIVAWLASGRPTVVQVQEWATIVMLTPDGFGIVVADLIKLGTEAAATQAAVRGDELKTFLTDFRSWIVAHTHNAGVIPAPDQPPVCPGVPSGILSTRVKLE